MSAEPPSSGRPTGPPSGPLSGPSQPPSGPPSQPPGSSGGTPPPPEPHRPWWRSVPRIAVLATAVVAAVILALVFSRSDGGGSAKGGEVFLQAASKTGPDPFTESSAKDSSAAPVSAAPSSESASANAVRGVDGGAPGLYGGTRNVASCDVERQIKTLQAKPPVNQAFASVAGVQPSGVPAYLRSLTPVQLRMDTRVTNHGYRDGRATPYQAVLQAGTAVLVDSHGVPRARCACGNPLTPPVAQQSTPKRTGDSWSSYRSSNVVVVAPSVTVVNIFVIYDPDSDDWIARHRGDTGGKDKPTEPPDNPASPSASVITPTTPSSPPTSPSTGPSSPVPCLTTATGTPSGAPSGTPTGTPSGSATPCPPTSTAPSSTPPSTAPPTSDPGTTQEQEPQPDSSAPLLPPDSDTTTESASTYSAPGSEVTSPAV